MKTYTNNFGLLSFHLEGKDYITNKGDSLELPSDNDYVKTLIYKGYIIEKTSKTQK